MTDPLGLIGQTSALQGLPFPNQGGRSEQAPAGPSFQQTLRDQIAKVNELQQEAKEAVEDLASGRRDDVESIIIATQKADTAFRMLLQVRNKMMDAYDEVKQIRI